VPTDPTIPITAATVAAYQSGRANQESEVPVAAGELLTELSALEGLLVDWGTDMATLLAEWDAGSVSAYDAKMKATAVSLGLTSTHITAQAALTRPRPAPRRYRSRSSARSSRSVRPVCR
jgi:D-alanyl-D-alanine carboxypeptidase (penicillin-binding protein 5/6)